MGDAFPTGNSRKGAQHYCFCFASAGGFWEWNIEKKNTSCLVTREAQTQKKKNTPRPHICNVFTQVLTPARRSFLVETRRDDRCLWEGLQEPLACRGTGLTASYFGGVACRARHEPQVDRDDFYFIFSSSFKAFYWRQKKASLSARVRVGVCVRVWAAVCFTVRKGSVCIAQYYASLLFPPTLQRAEPQLRCDF